ncbi:MAG: NAD(P)H-dependent oxidoreductase [Bifidobacteriaceae bacterium]|nr:NAD(P)H-dependent oxidoreductase [Bifidobacteriaceae bacterium]
MPDFQPPAPVPAITKEQVLAAFRFRRATKVFDPARPVSDQDFAYILEAARLSPTSNGLEQWSAIVLQDAGLRRALVERATAPEAQLTTASHVIVLTAKTALGIAPDSPHATHINLEVKGMDAAALPAWRERFAGFLSQRLGIAGNDRAIFDWSARQAYIVLGTVMTAAALIGVESCALEGLSFADADQVLSEAGLIDLATDRVAVMVALGYRGQEPRHPQTRRPIEEIVRHAG